ncbi:MAG: DNA gyrase subunit A [Patescibacteria group bacterium]|nr:DNA gyrase subunit A [Patescibacteria group bacterium]
MPSNKEEKNNSDIGKVEPQSITKEMQESYLDYAMSVIISRALPDVRDGLKPVHRKILYAMWGIGLKSSAKFRKSANVVGEVMAKYHPHGDTAIYDSMVRMAQDFSMRYPLVNGQGNFGSLDGDSAAAMRYTEAKLMSIAEQMLYDLEKDTVDFVPNYDGSNTEPQVLPSKLPNLLLNGTMGIAVGMATNIPPHNLGELCDGIIHLIDNKEAIVEDLMQFIKGPDFPTGGIIYNAKDITQAYACGRGGIVVRAKTDITENKHGHFKIIITEIPYAVNKATLLEKIADLVTSKKIVGIKDLRDESNKDGLRIVIDLKKDAYPKKVLNKLFLATQLQTTFHLNTLALVDGIQPRVLNLKMMLEEYIKHRQEVVKRRTKYELQKAKDRAHILEGLKIAILKIDRVIITIKKSKDKDDAKTNLIKKFKLTDVQSVAILEMKLQQLANMERIRVEQELKEKKALIKELTAILASSRKIQTIVKKEIKEIRDKYADERRTQIIKHAVQEFKAEDIIPNEPTIVMITHAGYVKRLPPETFKIQARGGKGVVGLAIKEEDVVEQLISTMTHADLLFFTTRGRVFQLKAYDVPQASRISKGQALVNFLQLGSNEKVSAVLSIDDLRDFNYLVMATEKGLVKKVDIKSFENVRRSGLIAIKLKVDDMLGWVKPSTGEEEVVIITSFGQSIRFREKNVRSMGRSAAGVRGIRRKKGDKVVGMDIVDTELVKKNMLELFVVSENGFGKRTKVKNYKVQGRGGSGIKTSNVTEKTGALVNGYVANSEDERDVIVVSIKGQVIRLPFKSISVVGRATQGVCLMRFKARGDKVASVTFV